MKRLFMMVVFAAATLVAPLPVGAQRGWISGTVTDSLGAPIRYMNVIVVVDNVEGRGSPLDTRFGDMTDVSGKFHFEVPSGRHVIKTLAMKYQAPDRNVAVRPGEDVSVQIVVSKKPEAEPAPVQQVVTREFHGSLEELAPIGTYLPRSKPVHLGPLDLTVGYLQSQEGDSVRTRIIAEARNVSDQPASTCGCFSFWKVTDGFGPEVLDSVPLGGQYHYRGPTLKIGARECTTPLLGCEDATLLPGQSHTREMSFAFRAADFKSWTGVVEVTCIYFYGKSGDAWVDTKFAALDRFEVPVRPIGMPYKPR